MLLQRNHLLHCLPHPLCNIHQAEGGVFVCLYWFPHIACCQDTERCRRGDSYIATLQDHCHDCHMNANKSHRADMQNSKYMKQRHNIQTERSSKLEHLGSRMVTVHAAEPQCPQFESG